MRLATLEVAEDDAVGVVADLRIADTALRVVEENADGPGGDVEDAKLAAPDVVADLVGGGGVVAEVRVPVAVVTRRADGEDYVLAAHRVEGAEGALAGLAGGDFSLLGHLPLGLFEGGLGDGVGRVYLPDGDVRPGPVLRRVDAQEAGAGVDALDRGDLFDTVLAIVDGPPVAAVIG